MASKETCKRRYLHQICEVESSVSHSSTLQQQQPQQQRHQQQSISKTPVIVKRTKTITKNMTRSLQGRPAKASKFLRDQEDKIKQDSWKMALLEECLYLKYGGAQAVFNDMTLLQACIIIKELFSEKSSDQFNEMVQHTNYIRNSIIDPLGQEYTLLSGEYFLNRLIQNNRVCDNKLDLEEFLIVFVYQIFQKTSIEGFKEIVTMISQINKNCWNQTSEGQANELGLISSLSPQYISKIVQLSEDLFLVYDLLFQIMKGVFQVFYNKKLIMKFSKSL